MPTGTEPFDKPDWRLMSWRRPNRCASEFRAEPSSVKLLKLSDPS
jgi:hypothetical protein